MSVADQIWINIKFDHLKDDLEAIVNSNTILYKYKLLLKMKDGERITTITRLIIGLSDLSSQDRNLNQIIKPIKELFEEAEVIRNNNIYEDLKDPTDTIKKIIGLIEKEKKSIFG